MASGIDGAVAADGIAVTARVIAIAAGIVGALAAMTAAITMPPTAPNAGAWMIAALLATASGVVLAAVAALDELGEP